MNDRPPRLKETPSQTAGPYVHIGLTPSLEGISGSNVRDLGSDIGMAGGERILVRGRIVDGAGAPVTDAVVELWQADANGNYDTKTSSGWGRAAADGSGAFTFNTIKPGPVAGPSGHLIAPHLTLWIVARGINIGLHTRLYFSDEAEANAADPVLNRISDPHRRQTLVAERSEIDGKTTYSLDIHLQGDAETVFFDI